MIPAEAVEAAAKAIYESESYLNKWDWPVAEIDRAEYRRHARAALESAAPHMGKPEWGIFRKSDGSDCDPHEDRLYPTRGGAQDTIAGDYHQPDKWEVRGRVVGGWQK